MRFVRDLTEYEMLDTSGGEKLERWGSRILIRPDPQIIWDTPHEHPMWNKADARYIRSSKGGGSWEFYQKIPDSWTLSYRELTFRIQPTGFKHTGLFPEQAVNWSYFMETIQEQTKPVRVLNLFAYTGCCDARLRPQQGRKSAMWTHQREWLRGRGKTQRFPVCRTDNSLDCGRL